MVEQRPSRWSPDAEETIQILLLDAPPRHYSPEMLMWFEVMRLTLADLFLIHGASHERLVTKADHRDSVAWIADDGEDIQSFTWLCHQLGWPEPKLFRLALARQHCARCGVPIYPTPCRCLTHEAAPARNRARRVADAA